MAALVSSAAAAVPTNKSKAADDEAGQFREDNDERQANSIVVDTNSNDHDDDDDRHERKTIKQDNKETKNGDKTNKEAANNNSRVLYDVEHLATFSTTPNGDNSLSDRAATSTTTGAKGPPVSVVGHKLSQLQTTSAAASSSSVAVITEPRVALERLFELEKLSGIWTQRMQIELRDDLMLIVDCETNAIVERFNRICVTKPEAFSHYNQFYNNIIVFIIQQRQENGPSSAQTDDQLLEDAPGELHIFQCVSHKAQQLVADILAWKTSAPSSTRPEQTASSTTATSSTQMKSETVASPPASSKNNNEDKAKIQQDLKAEQEAEAQKQNKRQTNNATGQSAGAPASPQGKPMVVTVASSTSNANSAPIVNVNVKETVQVFNQIAALREKGKPNSPNTSAPASNDQHPAARPLSEGSTGGGQPSGERPTSGQLSSSGQLYKQRSIRATLAPRSPDKTSPQAPAAPSTAPAASSSTSSSSMASWSEVAPTSKPSNNSLDGQRPASNGTSNGNKSNQRAATRESKSNESPPTSKSQSHGNHQHHHQQQASSSSSGSSSGSSANGLVPATSQALSGSKSSKSRQAKGKHNNNSFQQTSSAARTHDSPPMPLNQQQLEQVATNESYVSVLNHCFDDIEKFIIRLQQAAGALRELQARRKLSSKRSSLSSQQLNGAGGKQQQLQARPDAYSMGSLSQPMSASEMAHLSARARGPAEDDYFEILSKFKLAFNLLAKLKGCIHEPNAPELVHFLFTPLAIIIDSAKNVSPPIDPTLVGIPYLNKDALELLSNCCTSKESDMWLSLGPNWTQTIDINLLKASRLPSSFQPIFSDGWAPIITELELIGLERPHPAPLSHGNGVGPPDDGHHQRRASSQLEGDRNGRQADAFGPEMAASLDYGSPRNGRSSSQDPRAPKRRGSPQSQAYATGGYAVDLAQETPLFDGDEPADSYGYRAGGHFPPRQAAVARSKASSRRSGGQLAGGLVGPTSSELMLDTGYLAPGSDLLASDDYTELHAIGGQDFYTPPAVGALYNGAYDHHQHLAGPSRHQQSHYRRSRQLHPRYSLPEIGRPAARLQERPRAAHLGPGGPNGAGFKPAMLMTHADEAERQAMLVDLGPAQTDWFLELQARQALIVRVLFTREANNDKELSVTQGEILEVLDDSRKWWKARNMELQVAHVPHTIVAVIEHYQSLDELLTNSPAGGGGVGGTVDANNELHQHHHYRHSMAGAFLSPNNDKMHQQLQQQRTQPSRRLDAQQVDNFNQNYARKESGKRNSKTAGAFRYF